jgi:hypothetical protein
MEPMGAKIFAGLLFFSSGEILSRLGKAIHRNVPPGRMPYIAYRILRVVARFHQAIRNEYHHPYELKTEAAAAQGRGKLCRFRAIVGSGIRPCGTA